MRSFSDLECKIGIKIVEVKTLNGTTKKRLVKWVVSY